MAYWRRSLLTVALLCLPAFGAARYKNLITTDDGSVLYFSTWLRMKGSDGPLSWKILAADTSGVRLVEQRAEVRHGYISNYYVLEEPVVSGDGSLVGFTASANCQSGSQIPCLGWYDLHDYYRAELFPRDGGEHSIYPYKLRLSANGRFALLYDGQYSRAALLDVTSGQPPSLFAPGFSYLRINGVSGARVVAGDGTVVGTQTSDSVPGYASAIKIARTAATEDIPVPDQVVPGSACIDSNATTVFFVARSPQSARWRVMSMDLATHTLVPLVEAVEEVFQPVSSNDGQQVLFLAAADFTGGNPKKAVQAFLVDRAGHVRQLTSEDSGVVESAFSGAGTVAYVVTGDDRILRIDVAGGEVREILKRTAVISKVTTLSPGSLGGIIGTGFAEEYFFTPLPLPKTLGGVRVLLDGVPLPLVAVSSTEVLFQIPWDLPESASTVMVDTGLEQVLDNEVIVSVKNLAPAFVMLYGWPSTPIAVHADWSDLVTVLNPAREGEVIHLYMTGLGEASPAVATGEFTPLAPLSPTASPVSCYFLAAGVSFPASVLWSGLAPGLVGLYQVSLIVAAGMNRPAPRLDCGFGSSRDSVILQVTAAPAP